MSKMAKRTDQLKQRNQAIREEYKTLFLSGYRHEIVCMRLGEKYFLQPETVHKIAFKRDRYQKL